MKVHVNIDTSGLGKLVRTAAKQVRYAAARSLTDAAKDFQKVATVLMRQSLDRPTPFTERAVRSTGARVSTLQAEVFVMPIQAAYLVHHVEGGTVAQQKPSPTPIAENKYGNLPKGTTKRSKVFTTRSKRTDKLLTYQRMGGKRRSRLRLLAVESTVRSYTRRWPFYERAQSRIPTVVNRVFPGHLRAALGSARW